MLNRIFVDIPGKEPASFHKLAGAEWMKDEEKEAYDIQFPEGSVVMVPDDPEHPAHGYSITGARFRVRFNRPITEELIARVDDP